MSLTDQLKPRQGWVCPVCNAGVAPDVRECVHPSWNGPLAGVGFKSATTTTFTPRANDDPPGLT